MAFTEALAATAAQTIPVFALAALIEHNTFVRRRSDQYVLYHQLRLDARYGRHEDERQRAAELADGLDRSLTANLPRQAYYYGFVIALAALNVFAEVLSLLRLSGMALSSWGFAPISAMALSMAFLVVIPIAAGLNRLTRTALGEPSQSRSGEPVSPEQLG